MSLYELQITDEEENQEEEEKEEEKKEEFNELLGNDIAEIRNMMAERRDISEKLESDPEFREKFIENEKNRIKMEKAQEIINRLQNKKDNYNIPKNENQDILENENREQSLDNLNDFDNLDDSNNMEDLDEFLSHDDGKIHTKIYIHNVKNLTIKL